MRWSTRNFAIPKIVEVPHTGVVIRITHKWPTEYDEGGADGMPQVAVVTPSWRDRSLSAIIENICFG